MMTFEEYLEKRASMDKEALLFNNLWKLIATPFRWAALPFEAAAKRSRHKGIVRAILAAGKAGDQEAAKAEVNKLLELHNIPARALGEGEHLALLDQADKAKWLVPGLAMAGTGGVAAGVAGGDTLGKFLRDVEHPGTGNEE